MDLPQPRLPPPALPAGPATAGCRPELRNPVRKGEEAKLSVAGSEKSAEDPDGKLVGRAACGWRGPELLGPLACPGPARPSSRLNSLALQRTEKGGRWLSG